MKDEDVKIGDHCWALSGDMGEEKLLVVMKDEEGQYQVCGAWECGIPVEDLTLIAKIERPEGYENAPL